MPQSDHKSGVTPWCLHLPFNTAPPRAAAAMSTMAAAAEQPRTPVNDAADGAERSGSRGKPTAAGWAEAVAASWEKTQPEGTVSLDRLAALAKGGDAVAMCDLGILHARGVRGAPKSAETAAEWFRKSAEAGDPRGATNLAIGLAKGEGVAKDAAEAMKWYRVAAESGMDGKIWDKHKLRVVA